MEHSNRFYKLIGKQIVPCTLLAFGQSFSFEDNSRKVRKDRATRHAFVSTVFLGLDHSWGYGQPVLFETLVFGGPLNNLMDRYCTFDEAVAGHEAMLKRVKKARYYKAKKREK